MRDFIQLFLDTTPPYIQEIEDFLETGDWKKVGEILHKIKPTVEMFGMSEILDELKEIEKICREVQVSENLADRTRKMLGDLNGIIPLVNKELDKYP